MECSPLKSGIGAVGLARTHGVREVTGSNPVSPSLPKAYLLINPDINI